MGMCIEAGGKGARCPIGAAFRRGNFIQATNLGLVEVSPYLCLFSSINSPHSLLSLPSNRSRSTYTPF